MERRAHLKKVQEWRAAQKTKVGESKQRKNDDKSAKKAAAQDQASSGSAAKDYVEIARAMMVVMKDLGDPSKYPSKSVSWPETDKGKMERREKEGREKGGERKEEREKEKNGMMEREKETEKRKEEARKVRKKIADDRYAEYDVSEYGLSSIVEEEEVKVECSSLYCFNSNKD